MEKVFAPWGIVLADYQGPEAVHGKFAERNKSLSDMVSEILDDAVKKGQKKAMLRAEKGEIKILPLESNTPVYVFNENNISKPVSYTHLDVYKRQRMRSADASGCNPLTHTGQTPGKSGTAWPHHHCLLVWNSEWLCGEPEYGWQNSWPPAPKGQCEVPCAPAYSGPARA